MIMHVMLEYSEEQKSSFSEDFFQTVAARTLEECHFSFLRGKAVRLGAVSVSEEKIRELNRTYRGKDAVTDILSFGEYADRKALEKETEQEIFLGELLLSPSFIEAAAGKDGVTLEREMAYVFSHGVLHLVGFDHEEEMFAIQERVTDMFSPHTPGIRHQLS